MASNLIIGVPASVMDLNQKGLLERAFHDGLFPNLAFRAEALAEEWPANTGTEITMSRPGLLVPIVTPNPAGMDPIPQNVPYEQWVATLQQYSGTIDTDMPTSTTAVASLFVRNLHQLGLQAGQSINRIARNEMFRAYLSGQTVALTAITNTDTSIRVASLNGFLDVINPGSNTAPKPISPAYPLPIRIGTGSTVVSATAIGAIPDDPTDPAGGPGTLVLSAAVGTNFVSSRAPVRSVYAPIVVRAAGGDSVDAIGPSDTFVLQQVINAVAFLRNANVQPHEDGTFHAHIGPMSNAQVFADPVYQRLNQSLPQGMAYSEGFIGQVSGVSFFLNNEIPTTVNTGAQITTAQSGVYGRDIGAETVNGAGVQIGRILITGRGICYEKYLDESAYVTEAGVTGKVGEFAVINNGLTINTERIRLILRSPLDRLQQKVSSTWSISTSFPVPSDITGPSGPQRFKRGIVLEHAL